MAARPPAAGPTPSRWPGRLAAAVVAAPVIAAGVRVAHRGWVPTADDATIMNRGYDVFSRHPPLVGQYSLASSGGGPSAHSPGPMLYWLVSLPAHLGPPWVAPVFMAVVNGGLLAAAALLARRRGGPAFGWITAVGLVVLVRAYGPITLAEVWNPWAALLPFTLLALVAWSVADGDRWLLPVAVVLASFVMQAHLTYVFPSVGLLLVAVGGGWGPALWAHLQRTRPDEPPPPPARRAWPLLAALAVAVACWSLPIYQQLTTHPGNVTLLARSSSVSGPRGGTAVVGETLGHALGPLPQWAHPPLDPAHLVDVTFGSSTIEHGDATVILVALALLVGLAVLAARRHDRMVLTGLAVDAALVLGGAFVAFSFPLQHALIATYTFRWFALTGLFTWLVLGLALVRLVVAPQQARRRADRAPVEGSVANAATGAVDSTVGPGHTSTPSPNGPGGPATTGRGRRAYGWPLVGCLVVWAAALAASFLPLHDTTAWSYRPGRELGDIVVGATHRGGRYLVGHSGPFDLAFTPVVAYRLARSGRHPIMAGHSAADALGDAYRPQGRRCAGIIVLQPTTEPRLADARPVGRVAVPHGPDIPDSMRVSIQPDRSPHGLC